MDLTLLSFGIKVFEFEFSLSPSLSLSSHACRPRPIAPHPTHEVPSYQPASLALGSQSCRLHHLSLGLPPSPQEHMVFKVTQVTPNSRVKPI